MENKQPVPARNLLSKLAGIISNFTKACEGEGVTVRVATIFDDGSKTTALILETEADHGNHTFRPET